MPYTPVTLGRMLEEILMPYNSPYRPSPFEKLLEEILIPSPLSLGRQEGLTTTPNYYPAGRLYSKLMGDDTGRTTFLASLGAPGRGGQRVIKRGRDVKAPEESFIGPKNLDYLLQRRGFLSNPIFDLPVNRFLSTPKFTV